MELGLFDGLLLGAKLLLGMLDGKALGVVDGSSDGPALGALLSLGILDGEELGVVDGMSDGVDEGFCDGMELGLVLVDGLGLVVGVLVS